MSARVLTGLLLVPGLIYCVASWAMAGQEPSAGAAIGPSPGPTADASGEPVVGQLEHSGWALVGAGGRHYVFGGLAVADYSWQGQRHIVTMQQDEPTLLPKPDDNFLYYRELGTGHRWAISRHPLADDSYAVYLQPRSEPAAHEVAKTPAKPKWTLFHRARLIWPEREGTRDGDVRISQMRKGSGACGP